MQNDPDLLRTMMEDLGDQDGLYRPGPFWEGYSSRIVKAIRSDGLNGFRANSRIGKGYADTANINPFDLMTFDTWKLKIYKMIYEFPFIRKRLFDPFIESCERQFQKTKSFRSLYYSIIFGEWFEGFSGRYALPNTLIENPQNTISINDHEIGHSYLKAFLRIHNYSKVVDFDKVESVLEIGGGFGSLCHTLLHLFPNIRKYIYLDIPPILYVGTQYLKQFYGDEVIDYRETRDLEKIKFSSNDAREILAICPWQIERIDAKINLFWNSASFQEMTEKIIINYLSHVRRMLTIDASKLCIVVYKSESPALIKPIELKKIMEDNLSLEIGEIEPEYEIIDSHYYWGDWRTESSPSQVRLKLGHYSKRLLSDEEN